MKNNIYYTVVRNSRRKKMTLEILPTQKVCVRAPSYTSSEAIARFVTENEEWIMKGLQRMAESIQDGELIPIDDAQVRHLSNAAFVDLRRRIEHFAPIVGVNVNRVTIRCQHTRWGSCSSKGNINLNCLLMLAPESVRNYVVVHELCHLLEMNHSKAFWAEVERVLPNYKKECVWQKEHGPLLMRRRMLGEGK